MKKFEQDYIKHIDSSAPDMDKLWEKIAGAPDEEKDITPFVSASRQCAHKSGKTVRIFVRRSRFSGSFLRRQAHYKRQ